MDVKKPKETIHNSNNNNNNNNNNSKNKKKIFFWFNKRNQLKTFLTKKNKNE